MAETLLITGAAGRIGGMLRPRLARAERTLRLLDVAAIDDPREREEVVTASVTARAPGFRVVWGVSDNTRRRWSLSAAAELGYRSHDDAETFADRDLPADPWTDALVGGGFCGSRYDEPGV